MTAVAQALHAASALVKEKCSGQGKSYVGWPALPGPDQALGAGEMSRRTY
jgi:hypothetical protein